MQQVSISDLWNFLVYTAFLGSLQDILTDYISPYENISCLSSLLHARLWKGVSISIVDTDYMYMI